MRLKSIKLAGFKSFVDPTTVNFPTNMSAVVGPNGCGKSNVIDAVRWVMGESSAKNLRGESMTDVIFNGSVNRQPIGQASIELVFDNSDGGVGGEYASYAEISIRRVVTRESQSDYYLNGSRCRRRDITDIFLGTGLGPRSYAIIEQGMISRLIESKPEELRVFIEEAAGISKYKERRRETENRMRRTLENLERLTDIRDELGRQLQHLERQAQAAEKYSQYKREERELKGQLMTLQWRDLNEKVTSCTRSINELEVKFEAVQAEHQRVDTTIERYRVEHTERSDELNEVQGSYYSLGAEVARLEQAIKYQRERSTQLHQDLAQTLAGLGEAEQLLNDDHEQMESWQQELDLIAPELDGSAEVESQSSEALAIAEEHMQEWQQRWDDFNAHAAEPRQQAEVQQSRIQHLEQVVQRIQKRGDQLDTEKRALVDGPSAEEEQVLGEQMAELELTLEEHQSRSDSLRESIVENRDLSGKLSNQLNSTRSILQQKRGRQSSLEALQQAVLEAGDTGTANWLQSHQLEQMPRLLEEIHVEDKWQLAVETVLGNFLQAVCVDDSKGIENLAESLAALQSGQVALISSAAQNIEPAANSLANKVTGNARVHSLLIGVMTADSLAAALQQRSALQAPQSLITPEGVWVGPNWIKFSRLGDYDGGAIARQQELEQLLEEVDNIASETQDLEAQLSEVNASVKLMETERQDVLNQLQQVNRQHIDIASSLSAHQAKVEQVAQRRQRINADMDDNKEQFAHEQQAIAEARQLLSSAIESMETDAQQRESLLRERDDARASLESARHQSRQDRDQAQQLAMRKQSLQTQLDSMHKSIERTRAQVDQFTLRKESLNETLSMNDDPVAGLELELEAQLSLRLEAEEALTVSRQALSEVDAKLREQESQRGEIENRSSRVRSELEQVRLSNQTLQVQRENIALQLEAGEQDREQILQDLPDAANPSDWEQQIEKVGNRISRLGPINLAAIDEFGLQSERKRYLDSQNEDLESALETLESAIRKIDKETRNRFRETFDKVNSGLQELFPRVFGGGNAYLELTGDDLLDTGISIMARPPGKKNSTIHLLSGGEKALTAIALVFSIFQLNPAPFCMLDEVDAPLDDANVGRYARMVKEMSEKVQFIYITHNKISMELADQLMGVTMHEPGVSRLVTVDVEEAAELATS